uniref:Uncharacterized protein n=1 Tax=Anguilla anguilla TaxID=7936 RepID=A0A0E9SG16_ANGAN
MTWIHAELNNIFKIKPIKGVSTVELVASDS